MTSVELDYFEEAVDYLLEHKDIQSDCGIGVVGISKAAEVALLMGTYLDDKVLKSRPFNGT